MYLYNGKWLFTRGTSGGLHFVRNDRFELNLLLRYRFQTLDPGRNEFYEGIQDREQSLDGGVEVRFRGGWGQVSANVLTDMLDRHQGQSAELAYRYHFGRGPWTFSPFVSWGWQSSNLTDYYFGVSAAEARPDRPAYTPGDGEWLSLGLNTSWWVADQITLFANMGSAGGSRHARMFHGRCRIRAHRRRADGGIQLLGGEVQLPAFSGGRARRQPGRGRAVVRRRALRRILVAELPTVSASAPGNAARRKGAKSGPYSGQ